MPANKQRLVNAVARNIQRIEKRASPIAEHFTPLIPRYHDHPFRLGCVCGTVFKTDCLDTRELARMIEFVNEHVACEPKEGE